MIADLRAKVNSESALQPITRYLAQPVRLARKYDTGQLRGDLTAGLTVAVVLLPQAIAFALIAELPPIMGIYTAIIGAVVGALWGSSWQMQTGPTNALSLLVLASLSSFAEPGSMSFIVAAGLMAVMVGIFQLIMGLARLGVLINFVSHSVIVGFAGGAGVLIAIKQLPSMVAVNLSERSPWHTILDLFVRLPEAHLPTLAIGIGTIIVIVVVQQWKPKLPATIISIVVASAAVFFFNLDQSGVGVIGRLPAGLPPLADLPLFNLELISNLSTGALAVGAIGLVQTTAIARSIAAQTRQRLDSNQEFVGQGLANIFSGLFSGYAASGSFSMSAVSMKAGAKSPVTSLAAGFFVLLGMFTLSGVTAFLPRAAMAGVLLVTAYGMIDREEMVRIMRGTRSDAAIMLITFLGTVFLSIEFAVLLGILVSFAVYIMRTSMPRVITVLPDAEFRHLTHQPDKAPCPQLGIIEIMGDLYFGAVNHIEEEILTHAEKHPNQRYLLIRMTRVNHCDFSGIHMLENVVRIYRERGGDVFMARVAPAVHRVMKLTGCYRYIGPENFLSDDEAISHIFHHVLDPAICIYECPVRAFKECQNLPKRIDLIDIPVGATIPEKSIINVGPREVWQKLHANRSRNGDKPPLIVDVREPREFRLGHIPEAELVPLPHLLDKEVRLPNDRQIIFVCRSGRRSRRAAYAVQKLGAMNVAVLEGGMQAWEAAGLLEAVDQYGTGEST